LKVGIAAEGRAWRKRQKAGKTAALLKAEERFVTYDSAVKIEIKSVILSLPPLTAPPRLRQWNKRQPDHLEVYEIDTDFVVRFKPISTTSDAPLTAQRDHPLA
jgi:preprotein translocase subunit Sec63